MSAKSEQKSRMLGRKLGQSVDAGEKAASIGRGWTPRTMSWDDREQ